AEALAACRAGRGQYPDDPELLFWEGVLLRDHGDLAGAAACAERLAATPPAPHLTGAGEGVQTYKARQVLGEGDRAQGRAPAAEEQWRQALAAAPRFAPARLRLAELFADQGRWGELDEALAGLGDEPHLADEAGLLRARGLLARREFAAAR